MLSRLSEIFYLINCVAIDSIQKFDSVQTLDSIQTIGSILTIDSIQTFDSILTIDSIQTFDRIQTIDSIQTLNSIQSSCQDKPGVNYDKSIESQVVVVPSSPTYRPPLLLLVNTVWSADQEEESDISQTD